MISSDCEQKFQKLWMLKVVHLHITEFEKQNRNIYRFEEKNNNK